MGRNAGERLRFLFLESGTLSNQVADLLAHTPS
jgi:hypothetical protein